MRPELNWTLSFCLIDDPVKIKATSWYLYLWIILQSTFSFQSYWKKYINKDKTDKDSDYYTFS